MATTAVHADEKPAAKFLDIRDRHALAELYAAYFEYKHGCKEQVRVRAYKFVTKKLQSPYIGHAHWSLSRLRPGKLVPGIRRITYTPGTRHSAKNASNSCACSRGIHCSSLAWCRDPYPFPSMTIAEPGDKRIVALEFGIKDITYIKVYADPDMANDSKIVLRRCKVIEEVTRSGMPISNATDVTSVTKTAIASTGEEKKGII